MPEGQSGGWFSASPMVHWAHIANSAAADKGRFEVEFLGADFRLLLDYNQQRLTGLFNQDPYQEDFPALDPQRARGRGIHPGCHRGRKRYPRDLCRCGKVGRHRVRRQPFAGDRWLGNSGGDLMRVVVVGGTGNISTGVVKMLLDAGHDVTVCARGERRRAVCLQECIISVAIARSGWHSRR